MEYRYKIGDLVKMKGTLRDLYNDFLIRDKSIGMVIKLGLMTYDEKTYHVLFGERVCGVMERYLKPYSG